MKIVVVGAGVSGLTCAVALLEASRDTRVGAEVLVLTTGSSAGTVSAVAGAMMGPVFGSGDARSRAWERRSDLVFRELARDPATGVRLLAGRLLAAPELGPGLPPWVEQVPGYRSALTGSQLPPGFVSGFAAELPFADMPAYLSWLAGRVQALGGRVEQRVVRDLGEAGADVVVNCSGLGARQLAGDETVEPVWGQHVLVSAPFVDEFVFEGGASADGISIVPHRRGVLLGGVRRPGRNLLMPDGQIAAETIDRAAVAIPELATAPVLGIEVGLRPGRPQVRLEAEQTGGTTVIHNYGHDSTGVFWSWGCAADVATLCGLESS
ncbi:MAG: FAD-dependent oxidoreductase [Streptosporangiaceae bacterium]